MCLNVPQITMEANTPCGRFTVATKDSGRRPRKREPVPQPETSGETSAPPPTPGVRHKRAQAAARTARSRSRKSASEPQSTLPLEPVQQGQLSQDMQVEAGVIEEPPGETAESTAKAEEQSRRTAAAAGEGGGVSTTQSPAVAPSDSAAHDERPRPSSLGRRPGGGQPVQEQPVAVSEAGGEPGRRDRQRLPHGNALGTLIEGQFAALGSPCRSYSDLERRSGISREALSRYVTARADRRRSPTIDTLVAIADAMHLSLEAVCQAAAASVKGYPLPPQAVRQTRQEVLATLVAGLSDDQFSAVVELLRHMRPVTS